MNPSGVDTIFSNIPEGERRITSNIVLVPGNMPYQFVLKKTRKSTSLVDFFKFQNEKRFYDFLSENPTVHLRVPDIYSYTPGKALYMEYIDGKIIRDFRSADFVSGYIEFQHQEIPLDPVIDFFNQTFRGFDYKIGGVALLTLSRRESMTLALRIMKQYREFCKAQPKLPRPYWQHGDLHRGNVINTDHGDLYFIDFENSFFTRRWPLCEIFGECIQCEQKGIEFHPDLFRMYWKFLPENSPIHQLDLELQLKFAMMRKAVHVILQSKFEFRKNLYRQFLQEKLEGRNFQKWSHSIVSNL